MTIVRNNPAAYRSHSPISTNWGRIFKSSLLCATLLLVSISIPEKGWSLTLSPAPMQEYIFLEGKKHFDTENLESAEEVWKNIFRDPLYGPVAYVILSRAYRKTGNLDKAESFLKEFLRNYPNSVYLDMVRLSLVEILCEQGKPEAVPVLTSMLKKASEKDNIRLTLRLAALERHIGNYSKASAHYRDLFLNYPASVEGLQAADDLAWMVVHEKIAKPTFSENEQLSRAERLFAKGRFDLAASAYEALLKSRPSDKGLMLKLARCRYKDRRNQKAINILKDILKGDVPDNLRMDAYYLLSLVYWRLDNYKEFELCNTKILEKGSSSLKKKAMFNMGAHHFEKGRFPDAQTYFDRLSKSGPDFKVKVKLKWKTGWIKYMNQQYKEAADTFRETRFMTPGGKIENAAKYWQARSLINLNRFKEAEPLLKDIVKNDSLGYYGFAAADSLKSIKSSPDEKDDSRKWFPDMSLSSEEKSNLRVKDAIKLTENGLHEFALINLETLPKSLKSSPAMAFLAAKAAYRAEQYRTAQNILAYAFGSFMENPPSDAPPEFIEIAFPRVHFAETTRHANKYSVDPHLIWAVIRQESRYDASAVSPAGALGLMQVTPAAAGVSGRGGKISPGSVASLLEPKQNLAQGIRILAKNLSTFGGKLVPAVASYNADIRKVRQWVQRNGKMKEDEFVETIPFLETRTYVKKVLAGHRAYSILHRKKNLAGFW